eukprot:TRINITY_DN4902_c0_g1_i1.p1 TRINITY_DN4902_c0_g1~~TRINITY_DN4902_c0_g1_i1.p1  ORF type:complete len:296 (+),score=27.86 TRINITY_DN4902_c0_g1_i1:195-1082(+)
MPSNIDSPVDLLRTIHFGKDALNKPSQIIDALPFPSVVTQLERKFHKHRSFIRTLAVVIPIEIVIAGLYSVFVGVHALKEWEYATKPLPMMLLIGTAVSHILYYGMNRFRGLILTAFILSLIADVVLIPDGDLFFLGGLAVFLFAHVFYIIAFSVSPTAGSPSVAVNFSRGLPFFLLFCIVPPFLAVEMARKGHPLEIIVGVVIYSFVLSTMGWRTAARVGYPSETTWSQKVALIGVIFFICSDFMLAINRFVASIPLCQIWILGTYWTAQTLIAISLQRAAWESDNTLERTKSS